MPNKPDWGRRRIFNARPLQSCGQVALITIRHLPQSSESDISKHCGFMGQPTNDAMRDELIPEAKRFAVIQFVINRNLERLSLVWYTVSNNQSVENPLSVGCKHHPRKTNHTRYCNENFLKEERDTIVSEHVFSKQTPNIDYNFLRVPQYEAYNKVEAYYNDNENHREIGIVLPVGCGKSGLITLLPFSVKSRRTLVVAPNVKISGQLHSDFNMSNPKMFYFKCSVLSDDPFPESVEIRGKTVNQSDLDNADVVITNIQQLQGEDNRWINACNNDYFDLIIFDEAHHNVASSWEKLRTKFPNAKIINLSATPIRSDGQLMAGKIIYSYSICDAIRMGYVKKLKGVVLNPATLRYVRDEDGQEIEVTLDEVRRLGEEESSFRRSIVTSKETLTTIVDASIRELYKIREATSDDRHKIIASSLNYEHCIQIKNAYIARGLRADYIHSKEDSTHNERILEKLEAHELDVIVQVRKLSEGFDHPYLSVAAVFSIFRTLSPFVQFVGRIMRVIEQNTPQSIQNHGTVVFHAGANIARQWEDFQQFSQADQEYFDQLLPIEGLDFTDAGELEIIPDNNLHAEAQINIVGQQNITVEEMLLFENIETDQMIELLINRNVSPDKYKNVYNAHVPIRVPKVQQRQADRKELDELVKNAVGQLLNSNGVNPKGKELDKQRLGRDNFVFLKSAFDRKIISLTGTQTGKRDEMTQEQLDLAKTNLNKIYEEVQKEYFDA